MVLNRLPNNISPATNDEISSEFCFCLKNSFNYFIFASADNHYSIQKVGPSRFNKFN